MDVKFVVIVEFIGNHHALAQLVLLDHISNILYRHVFWRYSLMTLSLGISLTDTYLNMYHTNL